MATPLLSAAQRLSFIGLAEKHLPTFWEPITIYKEPLKTISSNSVNQYPGYNYSSVETNIQLTPVYQTFSGLIIKMANKTPQELYEVNKRIWKGDCKLKVQEDASNYILNGKTEKIIADGKTWDVVSGPATQNFLELKYYYFDIQEVH